MKNSKFFYLYLAGGIVAIAIIIYEVLTTYPAVKIYALATEVVLAIFFLYMANKTYHEYKDKEMM